LKSNILVKQEANRERYAEGDHESCNVGGNCNKTKIDQLFIENKVIANKVDEDI
jgi:hypothetical protein